MPVRPVVLGDQAGIVGGAIDGAVGAGRQHAHGIVAHGLEAHPGLGDAVPQHGVAGRAVGFCGGADELQFVFEVRLLAERGQAALEAEQGHGDLPAGPRRADDIGVAGAGAVEKDLAEFGGAGQLLDRADLDAGLVERHEQEDQPLVSLRAGFAARQHEHPLRLVGERGPHLLPVDDPVAAGFILARLGLHVAEVGAGVGFGVALAPVLGAGDDAGQEALFLLFAAEGDQGRPDQGFAEVADAAGAAGTGIFLVENHLLRRRQVASAVLFRPADAGPARPGQVLFPLLAQFGMGILVAGAAAMTQALIFALQVVLHPAADFGTEGGVVLAHGQIAPSRLAATRSRNSSLLPSQCPPAWARLKCRCGSYSQVKPTPPCSWIDSWAQ